MEDLVWNLTIRIDPCCLLGSAELALNEGAQGATEVMVLASGKKGRGRERPREAEGARESPKISGKCVTISSYLRADANHWCLPLRTASLRMWLSRVSCG